MEFTVWIKCSERLCGDLGDTAMEFGVWTKCSDGVCGDLGKHSQSLVCR